MATKDSDLNQWTDPKDYGLPFVEIKPIRAKSIPAEVVARSIELVKEVEQKVETPILAVSEVGHEPISSETPVVIEEKKEIPKRDSPKVLESKKTASWVWAVLIFGFAIVAFIIWQIQSQNSTSTSIAQAEIIEEPIPFESPSKDSNRSESTLTDQNQQAVNQDSITSINNSNPNISNPAQTGTTIANVASGNLIRIESKAERPQYFIIVGSLPNEKLAIEEANQYFSKSSEMYLISPEEGSRNYRLALSKFGSFRLAAEELEQIKSQYTEELWILKY